MKDVAIWSLIIGGVFLLSALGRGPLKKLPVGMPMLYLLVGVLIGPWGLGLWELSLLEDSKLIEVLAEIAVLVSLLTAGLRLVPDASCYLRAPVPLATIGMLLTIAGVAAVGVFGLDLSLGAAVLLGAVLAPTDPVLAGSVQVKDEDDTDRLRYSLTGEAGLNDGAAFPFIMLGLGMIGIHDLGTAGWRWLTVDLLWAVGAGLASGWIMGYLVSRLAIWVERVTSESTMAEELLTLALIGLSYGAAMSIGSYGFLAVFAAGVATRYFAEVDQDDEHPERTVREVADVNEQFEQLLEVALVVVTGVLISEHWSIAQDWGFALGLFCVIRPLATTVALWKSGLSMLQRSMIACFGIRGIGSLYYLAYAIGKELPTDLAEQLSGLVVTTVVLSLILHSNLASALLTYYESRRA